MANPLALTLSLLVGAEEPATPDRTLLGAAVALEAPANRLTVAPLASVHASLRVEVADIRLHLGLDVAASGAAGRSSAARPQSEVEGGGVPFEIGLTLLHVAALATYRADVGVAGLTAYGLGGPLVAVAWASARAAGLEFAQSQFTAGFVLGAGAGYRIGPGEAMAELRYRYVAVSMTLTGVANAGGLSLGLGYRVGL